ncbi:hypothetical protein COLO4_12878 [Corchorus olitorius]|uniref:F-box domain-containing protein n=1 Tax=Corchorus olitorius TaxID=93759 RepID=A0A1R3JZ86_9ROSI|nr:hypothetical protein COLO4_12878 [Corchorus olitorius]
MDRILELPLPIIHQIMSYLSRKEVAQTNLLSKTWKNNLRPSFPILDFNHEDFAAVKGEPHYSYLQRLHWHSLFFRHAEKFIESMDDFTRYIDTTMVNFCECETKTKLKMLKFELYIGIHNNFENWSALVNKWIKLALENHVGHLELGFWLVEKGLYPLPETIFFANSITRLSLRRCKLDHPNPNPNNAAAPFNFHSLEILVLIEVCLDELMIHKLTSDSPMLGCIVMWDCNGFKHCNLPKLERLKTLVIDFLLTFPRGSQVLNSIEVEAPNLERCTIDCYSTQGPSSISSLFNSHHMRVLSLSGNLITEQVFEDGLFFKMFPLLEEFNLENSDILRRINISSGRLKQLKIRYCQGLEAIHIDTPNLHGFIFVFRGNLVPIASINAPCPGNFVVSCQRRRLGTLWYLNLKKLLMGNPKHEVLTSSMELREHSYNPDEFRQSSPSPPCEVQNLTLGAFRIPESEYEAMLDAHLSICYPKTLTLSITGVRHVIHGVEDEQRGVGFCMRLYEILSSKEAYRCDCSYVHCWRHYLKRITRITIKSTKYFKEMPVVLEGDALMNTRPHLENLKIGGSVDFDLEWCF